MDENSRNLNYEKIILPDWPSAVLISALIGQTACVTPKQLDSRRYRARVLKCFFFFIGSKKLLNIARFNFKKA